MTATPARPAPAETPTIYDLSSYSPMTREPVLSRLARADKIAKGLMSSESSLVRSAMAELSALSQRAVSDGKLEVHGIRSHTRSLCTAIRWAAECLPKVERRLFKTGPGVFSHGILRVRRDASDQKMASDVSKLILEVVKGIRTLSRSDSPPTHSHKRAADAADYISTLHIPEQTASAALAATALQPMDTCGADLPTSAGQWTTQKSCCNYHAVVSDLNSDDTLRWLRSWDPYSCRHQIHSTNLLGLVVSIHDIEHDDIYPFTTYDIAPPFWGSMYALDTSKPTLQHNALAALSHLRADRVHLAARHMRRFREHMRESGMDSLSNLRDMARTWADAAYRD